MTSWTIWILPLTWLCMCGFAYELEQKYAKLHTPHIAWIFGTIAWATALVVITELLSLFRLLRYEALLATWSAVLLVAGSLWLGLRTRRLGWVLPPLPRNLISTDPAIITMGTLLVAIILTLALIALAFAPNNYDSMTYHLSRVMHWQQNASVAYYANHISRQVWMPPFAEFVILHTVILTRSDHWVNMVQWFAMVSCTVGVAQIARGLGAGARTQVAAALLSVSIPVGVLEATSTQTDYVTALWIVYAAALAIELIRSKGKWFFAAGLGLAIGLAMLAKGTGMVLLLPLALVVGMALLWHLRATALAHGTLIAALALAVCAGYFVRNQSAYGSPIVGAGYMRNAELSLVGMASTGLRNVAINLPHHANLPLLRTIGERGRDLVGLVHRFTGIEPLDPRYSLSSEPNAFVAGSSFDEDYTGNLVHTLLVVAALTLGTARAARRRQYLVLAAMGIVVAMFLFFSLLLKWQIWGNRLMLPLFVLWCPLIAITLDDDQGRRATLLACVVALLSLPWVFNNSTRPIHPSAIYQPREEQYFTKRSDLLSAFRNAADIISAIDCQRVGMILGENDWEYPLWILLQNRGFEGMIYHVQVQNTTGGFPPESNEVPCAVFTDGSRRPDKPFAYADLPLGAVTLFLKRDTAAPPLPSPPGVIADQGLHIFLLSGWNDYEADAQLRWMQRIGRIWIHAAHAGKVRLELIPHVMHRDGDFGNSGMLWVKVEDRPVQLLKMQSGQPVSVDLTLTQGYNLVALEYLDGDFIPKEDGRILGICFRPIRFRVLP